MQATRISDPAALKILTENLKTQTLSLKVTTSKDGKEDTVELSLGTATKSGEFPAKISGSEGLFLLKNESKEILAGKLLR